MLRNQVKRLDPDEFSRIRRLGKQFIEEKNLPGGYVFEAHQSIWVPLMRAGLADVFYTEDEFGELTGFLGASYIPDLYCGLPAAQAQFWVIHPAHRRESIAVRMFNAFEDEAQRRGTVKFTAGHMAGVNERAMKRFFISRGYKPGESLYWKNLCPMLPPQEP
jgi:GNAT superfamily N-acetyltransferase